MLRCYAFAFGTIVAAPGYSRRLRAASSIFSTFCQGQFSAVYICLQLTAFPQSVNSISVQRPTLDVERVEFPLSERQPMFTRTLPEVEPRVHIIRLASRDRRRLLCLSDQLCSVHTHWMGRSYLCPDEDCPACFRGDHRKWLGYLQVVEPPKKFGLLEVSTEVSSHWSEITANGGQLHRVMTVERSDKLHGVRMISSEQHDDKGYPVSSAADVFDQLCRIYRLPRRRSYADKAAWEQEVAAKAKSQLQLFCDHTT